MEIEVTSGHYRFRAVKVAPEQTKPWLCQEWVNVGLETEGKVSQWVDTFENVCLVVSGMELQDIQAKLEAING